MNPLLQACLRMAKTIDVTNRKQGREIAAFLKERGWTAVKINEHESEAHPFQVWTKNGQTEYFKRALKRERIEDTREVMRIAGEMDDRAKEVSVCSWCFVRFNRFAQPIENGGNLYCGMNCLQAAIDNSKKTNGQTL